MTMSSRLSNSSTFVALYTISSSLSMHRPKSVGESGEPFLTLILIKKYFKKPLPIIKWHCNLLIQSCYICPTCNSILIFINLFQSSLLDTTSKSFMESTKQQYLTSPLSYFFHDKSTCNQMIGNWMLWSKAWLTKCLFVIISTHTLFVCSILVLYNDKYMPHLLVNSASSAWPYRL